MSNYFEINVQYPNEVISLSAFDWGDEITFVIGDNPGIALNKEQVKKFVAYLQGTLDGTP